MEKRKEEVKFKVTALEKATIDHRYKEARYGSRAGYLRDTALIGAPVHLTDIALRIGQLSLICNDYLGDAEDGINSNRQLSGPAAKKAVKKIIAACDAVTAELREITSCVRI